MKNFAKHFWVKTLGMGDARKKALIGLFKMVEDLSDEDREDIRRRFWMKTLGEGREMKDTKEMLLIKKLGVEDGDIFFVPQEVKINWSSVEDELWQRFRKQVVIIRMPSMAIEKIRVIKR